MSDPKKPRPQPARKIALAYYNLLQNGVLYQDQGAQAYEQRLRIQRTAALQKQALKLGMELVPIPA